MFFNKIKIFLKETGEYLRFKNHNKNNDYLKTKN